MKEKIYVVIAAFNEEKSIARVIQGLKKHNYRNIVVVDDGSSDKTFNVASKEKVFVLKHFINRGQGASLQTGIDFAIKKGADYICTYDADGQHHPEDIAVLLTAIKKNKVDVALGSRFLKNKSSNSSIPFMRKLILKAGIIVTKVLYGIRLSDSHNGFRVFSRKAAMKINITSDRMEHASQIVEEIHKQKISFVEVPVTITYSDYSKSKGQSTLNSINIGLRMIFRKFVR